MQNTFGNNLRITLFGESHGEYIGAVIDGLAPGIDVSEDYINHLYKTRLNEINNEREMLSYIENYIKHNEELAEKHAIVEKTIKVIGTNGEDIMRHDLLPDLE